jgi:hypothetical protein
MVTDNDFVHIAVYSNQDQAQSNFIMVASPGLGTYRAHTVWGTFYEDWFTTTMDPRTPWTFDPAIPFGDAGVQKFGGNVDWFPQAKYDEQEDPIRLSSGWEMRLIEAEAALNGGGGFASHWRPSPPPMTPRPTRRSSSSARWSCGSRHGGWVMCVAGMTTTFRAASPT